MEMFSSVNWLAVFVAASAGLTVSLIFYFLPVMQRQQSKQGAADNSAGRTQDRSIDLRSAILTRLLNTFLFALAFEWIITETRISTLGMGILLMFMGMLRAAFSPGGWNAEKNYQSRAIRRLDNIRYILMYIVMAGIVLYWR